MFEEEGELTNYVECNIELEVSAPSEKTAVAWTVQALRKIADRLEENGYEDGHHDVADNSGRPIGTVYFNFTEGFLVDDGD